MIDLTPEIKSTLSILKKLTSSGRVDRRLRKLLRPPTGPSPSDWFMYVPAVFNSALDIKFESSGPNKGWSQAGCFSFKKADTIYDTQDAYKPWSKALEKMSLALTINAATPAGQGDGTERFPGRVDFSIALPSRDKKSLEVVLDWSMTQDEFVRFLIEGPRGELKQELQSIEK